MQSDNKSKNTSMTGIYSKVSIRSVIEVFFFVVLVVVFLKTFVVEFYRVQSGSMEPELYKSDVVLVSRIAYFFGFPPRFPIVNNIFQSKARINYSTPKLGEIVVIDASEALNISDDNYFIKRIVGIPGDTIIVKSKFNQVNKFNLKKNAVYNNGVEIKIPSEGDSVEIDVTNFKYYYEILVNEGHKGKSLIDSIRINPFYVMNFKFQNSYYFLQGDNVDISQDSRSFGLVPDIVIIGRAIVLLKPSNKHKNRSVRLL